ncbi:MAG: SGNH/GDSL hydrolase family protein [Clostridia bacterium]|nr:SGNH/GDSL hydrolase family protein [Clostridia bacterium]
MKKIKIVFQGDSITDAGRDKRNYHHMGNGYPKYASALIAENHPDVEFEFINFGISGNRTSQLFDRLYTDGIAFEPDIISILIGINDIWHRYGGGKIATTDAQIELNYRSILERIRKETNAKIIILSPYLLKRETSDADVIREDLKTVLPIVRKLADEFADVYIPLDEHFAVAEPLAEPYFYSNDGVHPNPNGAEFIGKIYAEAIKPLIEQI